MDHMASPPWGGDEAGVSVVMKVLASSRTG